MASKKSRCDFCGSRLGMVSYRQGMLRFYRNAHRDGYALRQRQALEAEVKRKSFYDFLILGSPSG